MSNKQDPMVVHSLEKYEETKKKVKEKLEGNPKLFEYIKSRIPMYGDYEDKIWKDIITNLMLVYTWKVPPSMASNDALQALFETHFIQTIFTFYEFVVGTKILPDPRPKKELQQNKDLMDEVKGIKKPSFLEIWDTTINKKDIN